MDGPVAADGVRIPVWSGGQQWLVSCHPPPDPPDGTPHGGEGVCVTADGDIVVISPDGTIWDLPAGRPEPGDSWEQTLRREMDEEACATVVSARLLGVTRGQCVAGPERGRVLVRSVWRADVELRPWEVRFEIAERRVVAPGAVEDALSLGSQPFAPARASRSCGAITGRVLADHDFHPDEPTVRIFRTPSAGVLRLDDRAAISEADYGGIVLRQGPGLTRPAPALAQLTLIKVATLVRPGVVQASAKVRRAPTWPGLRPSPRRHVLDALK